MRLFNIAASLALATAGLARVIPHPRDTDGLQDIVSLFVECTLVGIRQY